MVKEASQVATGACARTGTSGLGMGWVIVASRFSKLSKAELYHLLDGPALGITEELEQEEEKLEFMRWKVWERGGEWSG